MSDLVYNLFTMEKVKEFIVKNNLIEKGQVIGVGVSGGSDSMALLNILVGLQEELDFEVVGIHINHGIREESRDEEEFVVSKCRNLGVRVYKFKIDAIKLSKEKNQSSVRFSTVQYKSRLSKDYFVKLPNRLSQALS